MGNLTDWNFSYEETVVLGIASIVLLSATGLIGLAILEEFLSYLNKRQSSSDEYFQIKLAKMEQEKQVLAEEIVLLKKEIEGYQKREMERLILKETLKKIRLSLEKLNASVRVAEPLWITWFDSVKKRITSWIYGPTDAIAK